MNLLISKSTGILSSIAFIIVLLIGSNLMVLEEPAEGTYAYIFIGLFIIAAIGVLFFIFNNIFAGSVCGIILMTGLVYLFNVTENGTGIENHDDLLYFLSVMMVLSHFVGLLFESIFRER